ncbi:hypothetical protein JK635_01070 [Neobacillus sp. YIM B02564]|jgi:hypothetical protein|uniref:Uncharacterized protein n=1 Tax=Neobacillus paridis TaxID=2803862 RepID=A0ABS1TLP4_9BACI|nr:hypothetical protein [Neobacillus paridis]MBL4950835.1 hypothetical protein [Neobacillus paridis]
MSNVKLQTSKQNECKDGKNGYNIIEFNVSDPAESLFAVVTPVKKH